MAWPSSANFGTTHVDSGADDPSQARADILALMQDVENMIDGRGEADGVAPLNASSLIPSSYLTTVPISKGGTGATNAADARENLGIPNSFPGTTNAIFVVGVYFSGDPEVTVSGNILIMQKKIWLPAGGLFLNAQVTGIGGIDTGAAGDTIFKISDTDYAQAGSPNTMTLTLPNNDNVVFASQDITILTGNFLYVFCTQITGGHSDIQLQLVMR